jgi:hypothetical protein
MRLIIPFYNKKMEIFTIQARAIDPNDSLRYITLKQKDESIPKIYGLERLNENKCNYCFEGPIDSMFIENSLALSGSTVDLKRLPFSTKNTIFVYDNEPRNKEIIKCMNKTILCGYKICIWPSGLAEKDVNDMVLAGLNPKEIIDNNTFYGLMATAKLNNWKKV